MIKALIKHLEQGQIVLSLDSGVCNSEILDRGVTFLPFLDLGLGSIGLVNKNNELTAP